MTHDQSGIIVEPNDVVEAAVALAPSTANILLVDDQPENLLALEAALSRLGHNLIKAGSAKQALKLLLDDEFAVILLDAHMPGMDGFETASLIREREKTRNVPIIFLTAMYKDDEKVFRGYSLGAVDYILKPFAPEVLRAKVSVFIDLYQKTLAVKRQAELLEQENCRLDEANRQITSLCNEIEKQNNDLSIRVDERTASLAKANAALRAEIAERMRAEEERNLLLIREKEAREQAEAANRAKDEFLAIVSHELRSPLNAIFGWLQLLRSGKLDEDGNVRALDTIERNVRTQAKLIEDILDVSRIVTGKMHLDMRQVEIVPLIESAVDAIRPDAASKSIRVSATFDNAISRIPCDPNRIYQVISNLLSNAIKFTPPGGSIDVRLERAMPFVNLVVRDTGTGISKDFLPYVFDRFRQAQSAMTRKHGGLGLGLAIARHLLEMHGGFIDAHSDGEGRGATFIVRLPAHIGADRESECMVKASSWAYDDNSDSLAGQDALAGVRVLIVDDHEDTLGMLVTGLAQYGAEVRSASSVAEALATLSLWWPDLLVSDIGMPEEDGFSLIRKIRTMEASESSQIPAVALTAFAADGDRQRVLESGFQAYVTKPIEPSELVKIIAALKNKAPIGSARTT